jgi:2'-5' RNA ligase
MSFENDITQIMGLMENTGEHDYSTVQIYVSKEISEKALSFGLSIPDDQIYEDPSNPSLGRELETHITVKYGLTTEDAEDVIKVLPKETIKVKLGKVSLFENDEKEYDVVKVDVESDQLHKMHEALSDLPNEDENPEYIPHMTIAYVKKGEGKQYEGKDDLEGTEFEVKEVTFKDKKGNSRIIELSGK